MISRADSHDALPPSLFHCAPLLRTANPPGALHEASVWHSLAPVTSRKCLTHARLVERCSGLSSRLKQTNTRPNSAILTKAALSVVQGCSPPERCEFQPGSRQRRL
ncbi:hypothetical protein E2C01_042418 [Portunus trituberculatus]|uniref:Uncharacterized protein n=1 Tax=Portunus trituberculatus TaxID=210409 RepID=A0A5B7FTE6_PORTR|nr:hypothetical protein [Portunus trituberculatus]